MPNSTTGLIGHGVLIKKVKPLLKEQRGVLHLYTIDEEYGILKNYFVAAKSVFPNYWEYFIKEKGFNFLMSLFPTLFQLCLSNYNDFRIGSISEILSCIKENHSLDNSSLTDGNAGCAKEILSVINKCFKETLKSKL